MDHNPEDITVLREFKKQLFSLYWERFGTFYLHAMPHPDLKIGKRGLIGDEPESGIILVIGPRAARDIRIEQDWAYAELQFGYTWEQVFIPWDAVFRYFDKSQQTVSQMRIFLGKLQSPIESDSDSAENDSSLSSGEVATESKGRGKRRKDNVIEVDFGGKNKK
ncbi:putative stringent starvation protein B [Leptospira fainei serovar Hurstbridge str. BUT 6]|uniref:Stringent starvation protein B n=1 Tax=Leptospira fainei serovar Hurstbridge str. BUT 6 TaxID=1193011 RepID=S3UW82_9LEPT|nr:ClpXP protease specificity-enhancing factor SspB [Leptospira fainei]EPG72594.1 putative stringent starvation protein B [Leptospira fainei serovar Hurstbridge str. BUT 6]